MQHSANIIAQKEFNHCPHLLALTKEKNGGQSAKILPCQLKFLSLHKPDAVHQEVETF
jgi:hypothetical protein